MDEYLRFINIEAQSIDQNSDWPEISKYLGAGLDYDTEYFNKETSEKNYSSNDPIEFSHAYFIEIAKIIKEKQPKSFLLENVRHLLKHDNGKTFDVIYNILTKELCAPFDLLKDYGNSIMTSKNFNRIESKWVEALVQIIGESPIDLERFITEDPSLFEKGQFRALGGINGLQRSPKVLLVLEELRTAPMLGKLQEAFKRKHA